MRRGAFRGAYAVTARFNDAVDQDALAAQLEKFAADTKVAGGEIWIALDPAGQPVSMEEKLRGGDKKIKACLMIDTLLPAGCRSNRRRTRPAIRRGRRRRVPRAVWDRTR